MNSNRSILFIPCLVICSVLVPKIAPSDSRAGLPSAEEIIHKVLNGENEKHKSGEKFTNKVIVDIDKLDGDGQVEEREHRLYDVILINGHNYNRLIQKNGKPLTEEEKQEEKEREQEIRKKIKDIKKKEKDKPFFNREFADRFVIKLIGQEMVRGRPAFVLSFKPDTSKDLPEENDEDRFFNAATGKIWIDQEDYDFARIDAKLMHSIRIGLGFIANFKKINLRLELSKHVSGNWLPMSQKVYVWGRTMVFKPIREWQKVKYFDYKMVK
ncbi:MAG: hypothetical protein GY847_14065 [Proteobacteria bacterium]|nr:hypothetical protein [Pseudomonadota bacterium]